MNPHGCDFWGGAIIKTQSLPNPLSIGRLCPSLQINSNQDEWQKGEEQKTVYRSHAPRPFVDPACQRDAIVLLGNNSQLEYGGDIAVQLDTDFIFAHLSDRTIRQTNFAFLNCNTLCRSSISNVTGSD